MTVDDYNAFVALGKGMAGPQRLQGAAVERPVHHRRRPDRLDVRRPPDLLVHLGALPAGDGRRSGATTTRPTRGSRPQTARNRAALLYFINVGGCPYGAIGLDQDLLRPVLRRRRGQPRLDRSTPTGPTRRRRPPLGPRRTPSPRRSTACGSSPTASRRVGTPTSRVCRRGPRSTPTTWTGGRRCGARPITIPGSPNLRFLSFRFSYAHGPSSAADTFKLFIEDDGGNRTEVWSVAGNASTQGAGWRTARVNVSSGATRTIRLVFQATDASPNSLMEIGIDDVILERAAT